MLTSKKITLKWALGLKFVYFLWLFSQKWLKWIRSSNNWSASDTKKDGIILISFRKRDLRSLDDPLNKSSTKQCRRRTEQQRLQLLLHYSRFD